MRQVIFQMMVTADGFFEGPNRDIAWHNVDAEFNEYAIDLLDHIDTLIFGRVTYELMASYWPTEEALTDDPLVASRMNDLKKLVVSRTLIATQWNNTTLIKADPITEISDMKQETGKDMAIFGSAELASSLIHAGIIDEIRLIVNPVALGSGKSVFAGLQKPLPLTLKQVRIFSSGNVLLAYTPTGLMTTA